MKKIFIAVCALALSVGIVSTAHAASFDGTNPITVSEKNIVVRVLMGEQPGYGVYAEILGTNKKVTDRCNTTTGCTEADGVRETTLDVYDLARGNAYTLKVCDLDKDGKINTGFECPEKQFVTSSTDTRVGKGEWWYSSSFDIETYPQTTLGDPSFWQFETSKLCGEHLSRRMFRELRNRPSSNNDRANISFTDCFTHKIVSNGPPPEAQFTDKLISFRDQFKKSLLDPYFYQYTTGGDTYKFGGPFETIKECEDEIKLLGLTEDVFQPCFVTREIPKENISAGSVSGNPMGTFFFSSTLETSPLPKTGAPNKEVCEIERKKYEDVVRKDPLYATATNITSDCYEAGEKPYNLLAPLPGLTRIDENLTFSDYLNIILRIAIGVALVAAILVIVYSGFEYAIVESVSKKSGAMGRISNALWSLVFILVSYLILNTINPRLVNNTVSVQKATVEFMTIDALEGGDIDEPTTATATNCGPNSLSPNTAKGYCMFGTPGNPKPTGDIPQIVQLLESGYTISKISIFTDNRRVIFRLEKGSDIKNLGTSVIGFGANGVSEIGAGTVGDKKTPKGTWATQYVRVSNNQSQRITNQKGQSMGGVAIMLNVGSRGIAIHGNTKNAPGKSAGCVLMYNDDLMALAPFITGNIPVFIGTL